MLLRFQPVTHHVYSMTEPAIPDNPRQCHRFREAGGHKSKDRMSLDFAPTCGRIPADPRLAAPPRRPQATVPDPYHPHQGEPSSAPTPATPDYSDLWAQDARRWDDMWGPLINAQRASLGLPLIPGRRPRTSSGPRRRGSEAGSANQNLWSKLPDFIRG
jgi:hypothetical protein